MILCKGSESVEPKLRQRQGEQEDVSGTHTWEQEGVTKKHESFGRDSVGEGNATWVRKKKKSLKNLLWQVSSQHI